MDINLIKACQRAVGVKVDGKPGPQTWNAIHKRLTGKDFEDEWDSNRAIASSFADPADVRAFKRCKATGKTDLQCFAVGDNGIGQFGANTAQEHTPMCALHKNDMIERWGSVNAAAHKKVRVTVRDKEVVCLVEDRMSAPGRIDLNPAAAKVLDLRPPFLVDCVWEWED
jgi:hypothetical protein